MAEPTQFVAETWDKWRSWLSKNHATATGVWLFTYKKDSGHPYLAYADCVEETLCFGWVDSRPNALDEKQFMRLFPPRKPHSPWSKLNKARFERLTADGRMTKPGLDVIDEAKHNGARTAYDRVELLKMPRDLRTALGHNAAAKQHFDAFPPSSKKSIFWWIQSVKRPETRAKRVLETVTLAESNRKANHYRQ